MIIIARIIIHEFNFLFFKFCHYISMIKYLYSEFIIIKKINVCSGNYCIYS
jgi:hypothetical protein